MIARRISSCFVALSFLSSSLPMPGQAITQAQPKIHPALLVAAHGHDDDDRNDDDHDRNVPRIETRSKNILMVHGAKFKDSNGNGKLDAYEDWRLPADKRAADLVSRMTLEEKAGMMLADSIFMGVSASCPAGPQNGVLCETGPLATTLNVQTIGRRYLIIRDNPNAKDLATWTNKIQEVAENTRLGIPALMVSNPRNHVNPDPTFGISEATGKFSTWPGTLGLAATHYPELVKEFAKIAAKEWRASGIQKGYMYQADIATEPRWTRIDGTFGDSPELVSHIMTALVEGFQGEKLGPNSVSLTVKHFPGDGSVYKGLDPHNSAGRFAVYPTAGSLMKYQIPSFQAAVDAGVTSIMSYYCEPSNALSVPQLKNGQPFEEVGAAYNKALITDLLRKQMGFKGYVNSDSGILTTEIWGVETLSIPQRFAKAINAGVNLVSGAHDPTDLLTAVHSGLVQESKLTDSVKMLLTEMFTLGVFEDPYVDPDRALAIATDPVSQAKADKANRKSIVLLRNDNRVLPLTDSKTKLFVEVVTKTGAPAQTAALKALIHTTDPSLVLTDNLDEATDALVWARPNTFTISDADGLSLDLNANTGINVARISLIEAKVPTILAISMTSPWIVKDIEKGAAAVVATFDVKPEALMDVIRGRFSPTGRLPITLPADSLAVGANKSDVPGFAEDPSYVYRNKLGAAYKLGYGLSYDGRADCDDHPCDK